MKQKLERRLDDLKSEFESGQTMLAELEAKQSDLHKTLLRISGAMQVIGELLSEESQPEPDQVELLVGAKQGAAQTNWQTLESSDDKKETNNQNE